MAGILSEIQSLKELVAPKLPNYDFFKQNSNQIPHFEVDESAPPLEPFIAKPIEKIQYPDCKICYCECSEPSSLPCGHIYHYECLSEMIISKITSKDFPIICPEEECTHEMGETVIRNLIDEETHAKYLKFTLSDFIDKNPGVFIECPTSDCEYIFQFEESGDPRFTCEKCSLTYCISC
jgi:hypothetical protein